MYPTITIGPRTLHMTGVGIVAFVLVFLWKMRQYTRTYRLSFKHFFEKIPWYIIILYLLGTYSHYLIEYMIIFPIDRQQFLLYLSPYGYKFHYIGLLIGMVLCGIQFLKTVPEYDRARRIDAFFQSTVFGSIPLGVFLLLGDTVIGVPIQDGLYVSAITPNSAMATYDKVVPVGLYISIAGVLWSAILMIRNKRLQRWFWYRWFAFFFILLWCILVFQQYPRHIVTNRLWLTMDIRQYASLVVAALFAFQGFRYYKTKKI